MKITWNATGDRWRKRRRYQLVADGEPQNVYVHHCGHPTALWPYFVSFEPDGREAAVLADNGRGFRLLVQAKARAVEVFFGRLKEQPA